MGVLIRALKSSPLARPLPAVSLSALGLGLLAFIGLCATAPGASEATLPVFLPLTALARRLGAPVLSADVTNAIMYPAITFCCLGLAGMLWANSRGWRPDPRGVFWTAVAVVAVVVNITPVGSSDPASLAAYGRIAALGHDPYTFRPPTCPAVSTIRTSSCSIPGGGRPPRRTARWPPDAPGRGIGLRGQAVADHLGPDDHDRARVPRRRVPAAALGGRPGAGLLDPWAANPLLIYVLVMGGQLDAFVALAGIAAILISRRGATVWHDLATGVLIGVAMGIKINAAFVALGIAVPLIRERAWARLLRTAAAAAVVTFGLYYFTYGLNALRPLPEASGRVISPSFWRLFQIIGDRLAAPATINTLIGVAWPLLLLALAWYLYNRLSPDVPAVLAATCALTFAWVLVAPWSLPWYTAVAWVTLALLPRNSLTRWLTLATLVPALLHFSAGQPDNHPGRPGPDPVKP